MAQVSTQTQPRSIHGYLLLDQIGVGGMGRIYLAANRFGKLAAIKVIRPEFIHDHEYRDRFARETAALARVTNPGIVGLIEADPEAPIPWMAMEYAPGYTLAEYVELFGPLPPEQVRLLAWSLAESLAVVHAAGLVHRDLKPSNVVLSPSGPKILDFGVVQTLGSHTLTSAGQAIGSIRWMAPEQILGLRESAATDVHAWSSVVSFAATGEAPFGDGKSEALAWRIANSSPVTRDLARSVPELCEVVSAGLSAGAADRPTVPQLISAARKSDDSDATVVVGSAALAASLRRNWTVPEPDHEPSRQSAAICALRADRGRRRVRRGSVAAAVVLAGIGCTALAGVSFGGNGSAESAPVSARGMTMRLDEKGLTGTISDIARGDNDAVIARIRADGFDYAVEAKCAGRLLRSAAATSEEGIGGWWALIAAPTDRYVDRASSLRVRKGPAWAKLDSDRVVDSKHGGQVMWDQFATLCPSHRSQASATT